MNSRLWASLGLVPFAVLLITGASCQPVDRCPIELPAPTVEQLAASRQGAEVERELNGGGDCELSPTSGRWERERGD